MGVGARSWLEGCLATALSAVNGGAAVERAIRHEGDRILIAGHVVPATASVVIVAIGKAAAPMACAAVAGLGSRVSGGIVVTRDGHALEVPKGLRLMFAGHPVPDSRSSAAGRAVLSLVSGIRRGDVLLVLLSGGASALTSCPAAGLEVSDLAATTDALLACGADIEETNCLRKHISAVAGGRLAAATSAARTHVLAISDVPHDRLDVIGSGPCTADPTTYAQALEIVGRYGLRARLPARVLTHLEAGVRGAEPETLKPGATALSRVDLAIVARNREAREAALEVAEASDLVAIDLGEVLTGEARVMGRRLVALGRSLCVDRPRLLVAGGETVVRLRGGGTGGRNQELALSAAIELATAGDRDDICLLAAGTDGSDGPTDAAGGFVDASSVGRARAFGLDAAALLGDNDSNRFLAASKGLVHTGPTATNVMDLVLMLTGEFPNGLPGEEPG